MGVEDRDWWRKAQKERSNDGFANAARSHGLHREPTTKTHSLLIAAVWLAVLVVLYLAMSQYLKPKPVTVSATGDLVIPRDRDGHFYATGTVSGRPVKFLVDTGATLVTVSLEFAKDARLGEGVPTTFKTANGDLPGRIVHDVPVAVGPASVSGVSIGVGLVGGESDSALLGQSFLQKFDVSISSSQMVLRLR